MCNFVVHLCNSLIMFIGAGVVGSGIYLLTRVLSPMRIAVVAFGTYMLCVGLGGLIVGRCGKRRWWMRTQGVFLIVLIMIQGAMTLALMFWEGSVVSWLDGWDNSNQGGDSLQSVWDQNSMYIKYSLLGLFILELISVVAVCFSPHDMMHQPEEDVTAQLLAKSSEEAHALAERQKTLNPAFNETGAYDDDYVNSMSWEAQNQALQKQSMRVSTGSVQTPRSGRGAFVRDLTVAPASPTSSAEKDLPSAKRGVNTDFFTSPRASSSSSLGYQAPLSDKYERKRQEMREKYGYRTLGDDEQDKP